MKRLKTTSYLDTLSTKRDTRKVRRIREIFTKAHTRRLVLYQCALEKDLLLFDAGDNTEVGEKGLTLSGGQKVCLDLEDIRDF